MKVTYFVSPTDEFPYTAGRSWKRNDTAGTSHSITLPEDVIAGELLILVFGASQNAADITITTPTGWTQLIHEHQIKASLGVYYKRATDADTFTVTTSGNCSSSHIVLRVKNAGTPTGTSTTGTSGNINPPDHDPGESAEYLWLACGVLGVDSQETYEISVAPANYESFNWIKSLVSPETGDKSAITTVAERYLTASSENPGAFTNDSDEWCAATIAIPYEAETNEHDLKANLYFTFPMAYERLYITTSKDVRFLDEDNGTWQSLWQGILQQDELDEEYPAVLKSLGAGGTLILGNGDKIHTLVATANSVTEATANKLIFDYTLFVNWMVVTSSAVFIGLRHKESEYLPSMVVYYEPYSERTRIYQIEEGETVGFGMDDNCHIIDKKGQIRYFTGTSFKAYQWLPCYFRGENVTTLPHRNGIIVKQGIVKFLWEGQYPDPAGIWVLEEENLYHKHSLVFNKTTLNSLGAIDVGGLGALFEEDEIWLGASIIDGSEAEIKGLYSTAQEDSVSVADDQRTQIVTAKLFSPEINSVWQDLNLKYDPVSGGDFIVKQRKEASKVTEGSGATAYNGTWTANDTFTSSDADFISDIDASSIEIGDEIIVRKGQGAGLLAHITDISGSVGGTKTITIDEGLSAISSGTFTFSVANWEKMIFDSKDTKFSHRASLKDDKLEWKQFKIDIREHALEEIQIQSIIDKSLVRR